MAILKCPHCQFLKEVSKQYLGKTVPCPACGKSAKVVDTLTLLKAALTQYRKLNHVQKTLQQQVVKLREHNTQLAAEKIALHAQLDQWVTEQPPPAAQFELPADVKRGYAFENQTEAAMLTNFAPVVKWFKQRRLSIKPDAKAADISGYFDEVAVMLGDHLTVLGYVLEGIRYRQRKGYDKFKIELNEYAQADRKVVKQFCQLAYECAFFTKYHFNKGKNSIFIQLSDAPQIQHFFAGDWLEWYGLMKVATLLIAQQQAFACLRGGFIEADANNDANELDLFFLVNGKQPLWIECKTGEFRDSINKYQALRKRLKIDPCYTLLLVSGLDDDKAAAFSSMFKLTIVNENTLLDYVGQLFAGDG